MTHPFLLSGASVPQRVAGLMVLAAAACASPTMAAESYANCTGVIQSLPATINAPGTWCMKQGLSTAMTSGVAIDVQADDVTLDCNDFTLSGIPAGEASLTRGIGGTHRTNVTVRHCRIAGFHYGIALIGNGGGHVVENNHLLSNLYRGIYVSGSANRVRDNRVIDTGGAPGSAVSTAIYASADITGNQIRHVFGTATDSSAFGITVFGLGSVVRDNIIGEVRPTGAGMATGINVTGPNIRVSRNHVTAHPGSSANSASYGFGINGNGAADTFCGGNANYLFSTGIVDCQNLGGNVSLMTYRY